MKHVRLSNADRLDDDFLDSSDQFISCLHAMLLRDVFQHKCERALAANIITGLILIVLVVIVFLIYRVVREVHEGVVDVLGRRLLVGHRCESGKPVLVEVQP